MTPRNRRGNSRGSPQVHFRLGAITDRVSERVGTGLTDADDTPETWSAVARRDLGRYYALLAGGQREMAALGLTVAEASAICDALNGAVLLDDVAGVAVLEPLAAICVQLLDADQIDGLGLKWDVDVPQLVERLRTLSVAGSYALVDAVERFWRDPEGDTAELLQGVRLVAVSG